MKKSLKVLKLTGIVVLGLISLLTVTTLAFVYMSPQFGELPTDAQQKHFAALNNFRDGKFQNQVPTSLNMGFSNTVSVMWDFFFAKIDGRNPDGPIPMKRIDPASLASDGDDAARLTWFGHSAILLEIQGQKILIDPMLGQHAGPLPFVSPKRFNEELPIAIEQMPFIDAVIISHDHYDHLDYGSIRKLKGNVGRFYVPLGVKGHLTDWGIAADKITELNWWEEASSGEFTFTCAPARHFSGRGFTNNKTLWSSWIIQTASQRFYFSGDSGYGPHFKEIGERYGPFDLVMMECGQYNELWRAIHLMPEETVQAALDVKGKLLLPIHWGAFSLAMHAWTDPITRVTAAASHAGLPVATPKVGEPVLLDYSNVPDSKWW
jgi:L-ascorbate metabolism protein UlaG (beta-lactamase superfamily)